MEGSHSRPWALVHNHLKNRDYLGSCNLAAHLELNGIDAVVVAPYLKHNGEHVHYIEYIGIAKPDIIILPKLDDIVKTEKIISSIDNYDPLVVCLPTEFGEFFSDKKLLEKRWEYKVNSVDSRGVDVVLGITEGDLGRLKNSCKYKDHITFSATGHPRMDFYSGKYDAFNLSNDQLMEKLKIPAKFKGRIVTFASAFTFAHIYHKPDSDEYKTIEKRLDDTKTVTPAQFWEKVESHYFLREDMYSLFEQLYLKNPDYYFVIKIHPSENQNFYRNKLKNLPENAGILFEGLSRDFISLSNFHIHHYCTTGAEAMLKGGIPICHFQPERVTDIPQKDLIKQASIKCPNINTVLDVFDRYKQGQKVYGKELEEKQKEMAELAFGKYVGDSAAKCVEVIIGAYIKKHGELKSQNRHDQFLLKIKDFHLYGSDINKYMFYGKNKLKQSVKDLLLKLADSDRLKKYNTFRYAYSTQYKDIEKIKKNIQI